MDDDDNFTVVPVPGLPSLTHVRLYAETMEHIAEEHPEFRLQLPTQQQGLLDAIANPTTIHVSTTDPERAVVLVSNTFTYLGDPVHVPVKRIEGTSSARVATAYFSEGNYAGLLLWRADNA